MCTSACRVFYGSLRGPLFPEKNGPQAHLHAVFSTRLSILYHESSTLNRGGFTMPAGTLRHLIAIVLLPGTGTILVPAAILWMIDSMNPGWRLPSPWWAIPVVWGVAAACVGLILVVKTVTLFWTTGRGTLAPWDPPTKLVVRGVYRHVRNPMISGVYFILLGEAILFGSFPLFIWFLIFLTVNLIYMPLVEEPRLARRFGRNYAVYRRNVPRWIPRLRPWNQASTNELDGTGQPQDLGAHDNADGERD